MRRRSSRPTAMRSCRAPPRPCRTALFSCARLTRYGRTLSAVPSARVSIRRQRRRTRQVLEDHGHERRLLVLVERRGATRAPGEQHRERDCQRVAHAEQLAEDDPPTQLFEHIKATPTVLDKLEIAQLLEHVARAVDIVRGEERGRLMIAARLHVLGDRLDEERGASAASASSGGIDTHRS